MIFSSVGDSLPIPLSTLPDSWMSILAYASPAVVALLSAIALWVESRARGTSAAAASTSEEESGCDEQLLGQRGPSA